MSALFVNRLSFLAGVILIGAGVTSAAAAETAGQFNVSETRVRVVQRETAKFIETKGLDGYSDDEVYDHVTAAITAAGVRCRLRPSVPLITIDACKTNAEERAEKAVAETYPPLDMEKVKAKAAEAYPMVAAGDQVTFIFMPNPARETTVTGTFNEYDGVNVVVDGRNYPRPSVTFTTPKAADLMTLIDPALNQKKRDEFAARETQTLLYNQSSLRDSKRRQFMREEVDKAIAENQANGYVFHQKKWRTLKDIVTDEIATRKAAWLKEKHRREAIAKRQAEIEAAKAEAEKQRALAETIGQEGLPGTEKPAGGASEKADKEKKPDTKPAKDSVFGTFQPHSDDD
ncbi:MAG: hypothetical protein RRC34_06215 [Lentisphaeria bacterium]|nr:hypothetical protein [Lentisphaeria bacterium]